ncbi:DUF721 domain-containing protein [Myroides sp. 1354]|uniref:DUF721 domain-containing protein n=1 Tax=unclassified Myroides TaxID=2642485 RepID=UPI00257676DF|nr:MULTISPECIES: DUF721 domain-containing protein [unclassified Myroides]MDM1045361.1 DUF721 domain-containing protein [Myroides sp. R163-1]MDM1056402.1 DUF721 domain-containing protein [Myroides sp. 1354]MDM1069492.1 DUF721 domain-containing protein [Myroides sp. 1372]
MNKNNPYNRNKISPRTREGKGISELLQLFRTENNLDQGLNEFDVYEAWKAVLGPGITSYTLDIAFKRTTLYVKLSSSIVRDELSYGREKIIKMLNEELKRELITDLVLR